jgi:dTDP-4-dehydrorhamnose reductase
VRLLVTGAGGMLGRDVIAAAAGHEAIALARADLDVTDRTAVRAAVIDACPDVVVNCAAWTDVDGAEADEEAAEAVNGAGAGNVARAAAVAGAAVVHVSSDYVFDGRKASPYVESDPVGPISAYGRGKLAGERAVAAAHPDGHLIVRSSWLFGVNGRNFVDTMLRLAAERDEVSVVDDQVGCPTFTGHLASALIALAERGARGTMHVAGGGRCSWNELAREVFAQAGVACEVKPAKTADMGRPAPRPAFSVLDSERDDAVRLPPWRDGVAAYLGARVAS